MTHRGRMPFLLACLVGVITDLSGCSGTPERYVRNHTAEYTCQKLLSHGIACPDEEQRVREFKFNDEFYNQMLPIHERQDIIRSQLKDANEHE